MAADVPAGLLARTAPKGALPVERLPGSVTEVVPGLIYVIGGVIPANRPLSWYPASAKGWLPINCYALRDAGSLFLIDTGITAHEGEIRAGLAALLAGCTERRACITRRELDCMINLDWILRDFKFQSFHYGGDIGVCPLDFFVHEDLSAVTPRVHMRPDASFTVGSLRFEVVRTSLRLLSTYWYYEKTTRTLFSSDVWGFLTLREASESWIAKPAERDVTVEQLCDFFTAKLDWLHGANCSTIVSEIERLAGERGVDRICPGYGRIIEGRASVELVFQHTIDALRQLSRMPRRSEMRGWDGLRARAS